MQKLFSLKIGWAFAIYTLLDVICTGLGMGVPIFCIFLGFPVGWYIARRTAARADTRQMLTGLLRSAALTASITFVFMAVLWGAAVAMWFDPSADLANFGIPMILYEPRASFVGWLVLMIFISPFLQFLMMLFGAHLTWLWMLSSKKPISSNESV